MTKNVSVGLCAGRHALPVTDYIFDKDIENPMNFAELEAYAEFRFRCIFWMHDVENRFMTVDTGLYDNDAEAVCADVNVTIYATGLTSALIAALNALRRRRVRSISVAHYDRESGEYREQNVLMGTAPMLL